MIGIDEVGRGSWAGPLLVVAVRQKGDLPSYVIDSKLLRASQRTRYYEELVSLCDIGYGWVPAYEIDRNGLAVALHTATMGALQALTPEAHECISIDGTVDFTKGLHGNVSTIKGGDKYVPAISASSIIAKVARDLYMEFLAIRYPWYGFEKHAGYGTQAHVAALKRFGPSPAHRLSFKPVKEFMRGTYD